MAIIEGSSTNPVQLDPWETIVGVGWGVGIGVLTVDMPEGISLDFSQGDAVITGYAFGGSIDIQAASGPYFDAEGAFGSRMDWAALISLPPIVLETLYDVEQPPNHYYFIADASQCCGSPELPCDAPPDLTPDLTPLHAAGYTEISSGTTVVMAVGPSNQTAPRYWAWGAPILRPSNVSFPASIPGYAPTAFKSAQLYDDAAIPDSLDACEVDEANNYIAMSWYIVDYQEPPLTRNQIRQIWILNTVGGTTDVFASSMTINQDNPASDPNLPSATITFKLDIYSPGAPLEISSTGITGAGSSYSATKSVPYTQGGLLVTIDKKGFV